MNTSVECLDHRTGTAIPLVVSAENCGFCEDGRYRFRCASPDLELLIDDAPLPALARSDGWLLWEPGFYAGAVVAEVVGRSGQVMARYVLSVAPAASKAGAAAYERMVAEVYDFDAALAVGEESACFDAGAQGRFSSPYIEFARLRTHVPPLVNALRELRHRPLSRLRRVRRHAGVRDVRRIDTRTARVALQNPFSAGFVCKEAAVSGNSLRARFDVPNSEPDGDHPANRLVAAMLQRVLRRISAVSDFLRAIPEDTDQETRTQQYPRVRRRLEILAQFGNEIRRELACDPFASISRPEFSSAGLNAIASHPTYAKAYRLAWRATRRGVAGAERHEFLWSSPSWEIYERWCFLKTRAAVECAWPGLHLRPLKRSEGNDRIEFVGSCDDFKVRLFLQKDFLAGDNPRNSDFRSLSLQRTPDIVLLMSRGDRSSFVVLDAKYSTSRDNVLKAMASAHIYRDSLRWNGRCPDAAVLLVPIGGGASWLESESCLASHRVGVVPLGSEDDMDALARFIRRKAAESEMT